jgi:hypothetical protein
MNSIRVLLRRGMILPLRSVILTSFLAASPSSSIPVKFRVRFKVMVLSHPLRATGRTSSAQRRKPAIEGLQQIIEKG